MRFLGRVVRAIILCCLIISVPAFSAIAENAAVTIGVGDTVLALSGKTSPYAFVTVSRDGSIIGTMTAGSSGEFSQTFTAQDPGLHQLSIYAHTVGGENTDVVTMNVNIAEHVTTAVQVFLPSTLKIGDSSLEYGQTLELTGEAYPFSTITIYIDSANYATTTTDAAGNWRASLATGSLSGGQHEVFVRVTDSLGGQSYPTSPRGFSLTGAPGALPPVVPPQQGTAPGNGLSAPVITFPGTGTVWHQPSITIRGSARANVQIELWDGDQPIASVWSNNKGQWSVSLSLEQREYALKARACLHRVCSAFSAIVRFTYLPEGSVPPGSRPLLVTAEQYCFSIYENESITVNALVTGGQPPYRTAIQWDAQITENAEYLQNRLEFFHTYTKIGRYTGTLTVTDVQGRTGHVHFTVHVKPRQPIIFWPLLLLFLLIATLLLLLIWRWQLKYAKDTYHSRRT